jgi:hypothetical protein
MKLKYALPVIIIIFLLSGCSTGLNRAAPPSGNTVPLPQLEHEYIVNDTLDKEAVMASYRQNQHDTAQSMAQLYVDAIRNGLDLANDEDAIAVFDLLFNRQTLAVTNLRPDAYMPDGYQCDLVGSGPNGDRIVPLFIIFQEDNPRFFCPLSHYGVQSRRSVETYLNYLAAGDAAKLSQWLSIDGGSDEFLEEANRLMEHYRQYDLSKTEIVNFDYSHEINRFVYRVQDGNEEMFEVFMSYGDGFSMPDIYSVLD